MNKKPLNFKHYDIFTMKYHNYDKTILNDWVNV